MAFRSLRENLGNIFGSSQSLFAPVGNVMGAGVCSVLSKIRFKFSFWNAACTMAMRYSTCMLCLVEMYSTYWICLNTETLFSCFILLTYFRVVGIYEGFSQGQRQSLKLNASSEKCLLVAAVATEVRIVFVAIHALQGVI